MQKTFKFLFIISLVLTFSSESKALEEVGSDSRIRTLVYGKNDVFKVNAIYGYQTVIEFDPNEKIQTISLGNPNIFKIIPSQNRLFIKAMQNGQITNMTLITDVRSYQFELTSYPDNVEDIMYVVRFIYPEFMQADTTSTEARPMSIYSPISLPGSSGRTTVLPSFNPAGAITNSIPSSNLLNDAGGQEAPLSIRMRDSSERKGMNQSPLNINAPAVKSPFSFNHYNNFKNA